MVDDPEHGDDAELNNESHTTQYEHSDDHRDDYA
jgi:hypothetical protein